MTNPNDDYTSRGWLVATAALAVLILVSFIPPIEAGGVSLRRASIISDLVTFESDKAAEAAEMEAAPEIDVEEFEVDLEYIDENYDLVFMKMENGSMLIHSTKGDQACWLTEAEAVAYLWKAPWFKELYTKEEIEVEAPKGNFTAVAVCSMGGELIGPVTWHGYQAALMNLYRSKYSTMPLDAFKSRISLNYIKLADRGVLGTAVYEFFNSVCNIKRTSELFLYRKSRAFGIFTAPLVDQYLICKNLCGGGIFYKVDLKICFKEIRHSLVDKFVGYSLFRLVSVRGSRRDAV